MSAFNPETARTAQPAPDTETIIGLLGGLMPLLLQLQSQYPPQGYFGSPPGTMQSDPGFGYGNLASPSPMLDHQAAREMVEDINVGALRTLSTYLETYANQHAGLANCIPLVTQAARCFAMRDQAQTFALIWQAYRGITVARAMDPQLPPLRMAASGAATASSSSMLH
jgi:hypothetical protein